MFVNSLTLHNFRNIEKLSLSFDNSLTIFYGENGQGKTNIVESIFLLANASSFRTNYFKELINNEQEETCAESMNSNVMLRCENLQFRTLSGNPRQFNCRR